MRIARFDVFATDWLGRMPSSKVVEGVLKYMPIGLTRNPVSALPTTVAGNVAAAAPCRYWAVPSSVPTLLMPEFPRSTRPAAAGEDRPLGFTSDDRSRQAGRARGSGRTHQAW